MEIQKEAVEAFLAGHGTVGTTAEQAGLSFPAFKHVRIKADLANGDFIYVGHDAYVSSTAGYVLDAGESVDIPINSLDKVWVIGGAADQGYSWLCI